jgi:transposase-like protein
MRGRGASGKTLNEIITKNVEPGATVMTDEYRPYDNVTRLGFNHFRVNHGSRNFADGINHTNTIEGAWSHLKLGIRAIYIGVSSKHLQKYCAEFEYRYNTRKLDDHERFGKWFDLINIKNLRYRDLISTGRLVLAPAGVAPQSKPTKRERKAGRPTDRLSGYRPGRPLPL